MHRRRRQGFFTLMMQLFGLEAVEQSLIDARMAYGHRVQRSLVRVRRMLPIAAVSAVLMLYAVGAVAFGVRKLHAASGAEEAPPASGELQTEGAVTEMAEAVQAAV